MRRGNLSPMESGVTPRTMVTLWALTVAVILAVGLVVNASEHKSQSPQQVAGGAPTSTQLAPSSVPTPSSATTSSVAPSPTAAGGTPGGNTQCSPSGSTLKLTARNIAFDTSCLAVAAGASFNVDFSNQDTGVSHDFAILSSSGAPLFTGEIIEGVATTIYSVSALPPGTYRFQCDVHPTQMFGTLIIR